MARPTIMLSPDQVREVETLAALLSQDQIADYFGICRNTFQAICARDPEVDERYKRGKAKAIAHVANGLLQKARSGCTTSAIFYLKTQAGWREANRIEHTGPDGGPVTSVVREIISPAEKLRAMLDKTAERLDAAKPLVGRQ
ncbi:hypothetical protein [Ruegeria marina]|uniref:Uncharacterized protein n=1 Tax=Ruegeria marina TaxID=639004 RepID=A0A1G6YEC7_9RHOB|nr:hypothetical protein [Ruegeria marina]SDD88749.1 hypothetical protein SAMN04488239_111123 [Ruegeria marina]